jgi:transcription antitermination factor NusG
MIEDPWYVHKVTPQLEFVAANALREDGFTVFVPSVRIRRRKGKRDKFKAFFPGYMFVRFWVLRREEYEHIEDNRGRCMIHGPVTVGGRSEPIPESVIGKIAEAAARLDMDLEKPRRPLLKAGDIGIIKSGPMEGKSGEIVAISRGEAEIALKIFNAIRIVRARVEYLEAAE